MDAELKIERPQSHLNKKELTDCSSLIDCFGYLTSGLLVKQQNKNRELHNVTIIPDVPSLKQWIYTRA